MRNTERGKRRCASSACVVHLELAAFLGTTLADLQEIKLPGLFGLACWLGAPVLRGGCRAGEKDFADNLAIADGRVKTNLLMDKGTGN